MSTPRKLAMTAKRQVKRIYRVPHPNCAPGCQKLHNRLEAAAILGVHPSTLYRLEGRGLRPSRRAGDPRYRHDKLLEFMDKDLSDDSAA